MCEARSLKDARPVYANLCGWMGGRITRCDVGKALRQIREVLILTVASRRYSLRRIRGETDTPHCRIGARLLSCSIYAISLISKLCRWTQSCADAIFTSSYAGTTRLIALVATAGIGSTVSARIARASRFSMSMHVGRMPAWHTRTRRLGVPAVCSRRSDPAAS